MYFLKIKEIRANDFETRTRLINAERISSVVPGPTWGTHATVNIVMQNENVIWIQATFEEVEEVLRVVSVVDDRLFKPPLA